MTVHHELLRQVRWADGSFERLEADYDEVRIVVREESGRVVRIRALSHISLAWSGHWDESILEDVEWSEQDPAVERALQQVRERNGDDPSPGGGGRELVGPWFVLRVGFIDGVTLEVVAQRLELEIEG